MGLRVTRASSRLVEGQVDNVKKSEHGVLAGHLKAHRAESMDSANERRC